MISISKSKIVDLLDRVTEWSLYALVFAVTFSNSVVEIVSTLMIVTWALGIVLKKDLGKLVFPAFFMLVVYFAWVLLSCLNSIHHSENLRGIFKVLQYALIFLVAATQNWTGGKTKKFIYAAAIAVVISGVNGLAQYTTGVDLIRHRTLIPEDHLRRISSSFIHPNDFGAYLMVMSSLFVSIVFSRKDNFKKRLIPVIVLALSVLCLFLTGSRGAWISFAFAFITVGVLKGKKIAIIFAGILVAIFILMPSGARQRIYDISDLESGTTWERVMIWQGSVDMIKQHPVVGFGINTFSKHFPDYKPEGYPDDRYAHNCYLQMAAEIGVVGALFFLLFIAMALFSSLRGIWLMAEGEKKDLAVGLFGGSIGFLLNSAVDTHLFSLTLAVFFNVLFGVTFSSSKDVQELKHG